MTVLGFFLKLVVKILAAPVVLLLTLFVWICGGILYCSAFIFGLAGTVIGLLGLPMAAAWLLGKVQDLRYAIQETVYG